MQGVYFKTTSLPEIEIVMPKLPVMSEAAIELRYRDLALKENNMEREFQLKEKEILLKNEFFMRVRVEANFLNNKA